MTTSWNLSIFTHVHICLGVYSRPWTAVFEGCSRWVVRLVTLSVYFQSDQETNIWQDFCTIMFNSRTRNGNHRCVSSMELSQISGFPNIQMYIRFSKWGILYLKILINYFQKAINITSTDGIPHPWGCRIMKVLLTKWIKWTSIWFSLFKKTGTME